MNESTRTGSAIGVGDEAPDFALPDQHSQTVRLSDLRGRRVIVYFYPKAGTAKCTTQACDFRDNWAALTAQGVDVLGVSADSPADLLAFAEEQGAEYPMLSDADGAVSKAWSVWGERPVGGVPGIGVIRSTFIVDEQGVLAYAERDIDHVGHVARLREFLGV